LQHLLTDFFIIIMDCDAQFVVRDGSISCHLFEPIIWLPYLHDLFLLILVHVIPVFLTRIYHCVLPYVKL
jgi:hypothetical protein